MSVDPAIERALRQACHRHRRVMAARTFLFGASVAVAWLILAMLVDRWAHTPMAYRYATGGVTGVIVLVTVGRTAWWSWPRQYEATKVARFVERVDSRWGERLSTVVAQSRLPAAWRGSTAMTSAMRLEVTRELEERPPWRRVPLSPVRPAAWAFGVAVLCGTGLFFVPFLSAGQLAERQLRPWAHVPAVTTTQIQLLTEDAAVRQGESLAVTADVIAGDGAATLWVGPDARHLKPVAMRQTYAQRFITTLLSVQDDFVYRVTAGDATTPLVPVRVLRVPGVIRLDLTLRPPDGPAVERTGSDGRLRVTAGTAIEVRFRASEPLTGASVRFGGEWSAAVGDAAGVEWRADVDAGRGGDWSIELVNRQGVHGPGPPGMRVDVD